VNESIADTPDKGSGPDGPRSPLRVMHALDELALSRDGLSLARLSERLDTPKTSLLSLLRSLESGGYVTQSNGLYQLGPRSMRLGTLIAARLSPESSIPNALHPFLVELVEQTGETALLGVMGDDRLHGVYIDVVEGRGAIRFSSVVGTRRPLFCSAFGKVLLAFLDPAAIDSYLEETPLVLPHGGQRLAKAEVLARLQRIRSSGLSTSFEEIVEGAGGVASPVFDQAGRLACVLAVAAPIGRLRMHEGRLSATVHGIAERASHTLGFHGRYPGSA
jgi:DNA-binding IclR family transcriptional regulator